MTSRANRASGEDIAWLCSTLNRESKRFGAGDLDAAEKPIPQFAPSPLLNQNRTQHVLAAGAARYVGEATVLVVAQTRSIAEDAGELVKIDYEPLPVVADLASALDLFRYKPGAVTRSPTWKILHQPRLDWQMWFAAYRNVGENPWFERLMQVLLKGSPPVLGLLAANPFPNRPPKYARALLYEYRLADPGTYVRTGQWWVRRLEGLYFPQVTPADFSRVVPPETGPLPGIGGNR